MFKDNLRLLSRYRQIIVIFIKYGFSHILEEAGIARRFTTFKKLLRLRPKVSVTHQNQWERIRKAVEELGTTFIKFAQILSNRPDIIPEPLMLEFTLLQDRVPPFSGAIAVEIIEKELGKPIEELFESFEVEPFASASIAQVHRATLKGGVEVAVKVQRPRIPEQIYTDLRIMKYMARMVEKNSPTLSLFDPVGTVRMFEKAITKELSFVQEGMNLRRFDNQFRNEPAVVVPVFYADYSTNKVMVMEFINGVKPTDVEAVKSMGCDPYLVAKNGINAFFRQVFDFGFFHADPHPGNIFVLPGNRISFIDFGMMGYVLHRDIEFFADILWGAVTKDSTRVIWGLKNLAVSQEFDENRAFEYKIDELVSRYSNLPIERLNMSELFNEMKDLVVEYKIKMSGDFFLLSKALVTIEGVGRQLYPQLNIVDEVKPHLTRILRVQFGPKTVVKKLVNAAKDTLGLLDTLPNDLRELVKKYKRGEIKVAIHHQGIEDFSTNLDRMVNRLVMAIICGTFILSSSLLIAAELPPLYNGYSVFGIAGYIIGGLVGLRLLYSILFSGTLKY